MPVIRRERRSMTSCVSKAIPPGPSGYTQRYSDKKRGEYYPVHCLVSELTADDMTLLPDYFFILFTSRPALDLQHTIRVRLTDDAGNVYEAGIDVDFSL